MSERLLSEAPFVAIDTETTGIDYATHRLVELAAIEFGPAGEERAAFVQRVDPEMPIPADATRVHGIRDEDVQGSPTVAQALPDFVAALGPADSLLVAHHARFDVDFLATAIARAGVECPLRPVLDTLRLAKSLVRLDSYSLGRVAAGLGLPAADLHGAAADARLAGAVFRRLYERARRPATLAALAAHTDILWLGSPRAFEPPAHLPELCDAVALGEPVTIAYARGGRSVAVSRTVTPLALVGENACLYLRAWSHRDRRGLTYRVDWIQALAPVSS